MRLVLLKWHDNEMSWILCAWMDYDELEWGWIWKCER